MTKLLRKIKGKARKAKEAIKGLNKEGYAKGRYFWYREHCKIDEKAILLEAIQWPCPADNVAELLKELAGNCEYRDYTIWHSCGKLVATQRKKYLEEQGLADRVRLVVIGTKEYYKALATAKFLMHDDAFHHMFTKRPEQVYLNTWHGTPLMTLGKKKVADFAMIGNEQKNFFDADYILCPNEFTKQCLTEDYNLENFGTAKFLMGGYPRNLLLGNADAGVQLRRKYKLDKKQVIVYLPTWRKNDPGENNKDRTVALARRLAELDAMLSGSQIMYFKQHHINNVKVNYKKYKHIRPLPTDRSLYEFLNVADVLVTDYSSVMFDYMLTGRKIILYTYDKERFLSIRGLHFDLSELPFPQVETIEELKAELTLPKEYDETACIERFCPYDRKFDVTEHLCRRWIFGETSEKLEEAEIPYNGKQNVIMYMGGFEKNGLTTAGVNLLNNLDRTEKNYAVLYCVTSVKERPESINVLPEGVKGICFYYYNALTYAELFRQMIWKGFKRFVPFGFVRGALRKAGKRMAERLLGSCRMHTAIQFTGYNDEMIVMMEQLPCNRIIYVHNDMEQEMKTRGNANRDLLSHAYKTYDHVACVTEDIMPAAKRIAESRKERGAKEAQFVWCKNVIDHHRVTQMAAQELQFDDITVINHPEEKLLETMASEKKVFVTVGRYSPEKGHERLIKAFETFHEEHPDTALLVIGGHGILWDKTVELAAESSCPEDIFLVRFMSNPFPLLKQCDFFVLPSLYEGFGLVLVEADILGVPCFSTDIVGPQRFMRKYGGLLVDDSEDGILEGLYQCVRGEVPEKLDIDYDQYNREAIGQISAIL